MAITPPTKATPGPETWCAYGSGWKMINENDDDDLQEGFP